MMEIKSNFSKLTPAQHKRESRKLRTVVQASPFWLQRQSGGRGEVLRSVGPHPGLERWPGGGMVLVAVRGEGAEEEQWAGEKLR